MKNKEDKFFEIIAKKYMEEDGENLRKLSERLNEEASDISGLDRKIEKSLRRTKVKKRYIASGLAGCALIIFLCINVFLSNDKNSNISQSESQDNTYTYDAEQYNEQEDMQRIASILPVGYKVESIDHDNGKTIFYVLNDLKDEIILEEESLSYSLEVDTLKSFYLQDTRAYGISKADYSLITFELEDKLYTLTSSYDAHGLIAIGESIINSSENN